MNKIKDFIKKYTILDIIIIVISMILLSCLIANHMYSIFPDKGREFLIPLEILNGKVPYKDITLIYFPTAYYINAIIYKLLGTGINSLIIAQTVFCSLFMILYYFIAKLFLDRKESLLLTLYIIFRCIFTYHDLFSFIIPYSYSRVYGIMSFVICLICLIKLYKTDNLKYLYCASIVSGVCFSFKLEFLSVYLLLVIGLILYKKLEITEYLKAFILSSLFPLIILSILFIQGARVDDIISAIKFSIDFSKTPVMLEFLAKSGMYPFFLDIKFEKIIDAIPYQLIILFFSFIALKYPTKTKLPLILVPILLLCKYHNENILILLWVYLPIVIFIITIFKFKELIKNHKEILLILISAILLSQREFFSLSLRQYGTYALPMLLLSFCILIDKFAQHEFHGVKIKNLISYIFVILIAFSIREFYIKIKATPYPITSEVGTIYVGQNNYAIMRFIMSYTDKNIKKENSVLVLPEGNIINFMTKRKTNMKCFMMDRLYHDAYGEEKATSLIANTNSDYIILININNVLHFFRPFLYDLDDGDDTLLKNYLKKNYIVVKTYKRDQNTVKILKNKLLPEFD